MLFQKKVAVVTGASRGIGRDICVDLAREGAEVAAVDILSMEETVGEISKIPGVCVPFQFDVSDPVAVQKGIGGILEEFKRVDFLVNNAGITRDKLLVRMRYEDWDAVMKVNLDGVFNLTQGVIRHMLKQRSGKIVNVSSVVGLAGNPGQTNYAASKAGVIGFTKSLAREVASRGVNVNAVAPGYIDTDMTKALSGEARRNLQEMIPMQRLGTVSDVAGCVKFLLSDSASYITGHVLHVNGGMYM